MEAEEEEQQPGPSTRNTLTLVSDEANPGLDYEDYYDVAYPNGTFEDMQSSIETERAGARKRQTAQAEKMLESSKKK